MVITFSDLEDVNLELFRAAVDDWKTVMDKLKPLVSDAKQGMQAKSDAAQWAGVDASVTKPFVSEMASEIGDLHVEASAIWRILSEAYGDILEIQRDLKTEHTVAKKAHLAVHDNQDGTVRCTASAGAGHAQEPLDRAEDERAAERRINTLLRRVNEIDTTTATALKSIHGGDPHNAGHAAYDSLADAREVLRSEKRFKDAEDYIFDEMKTNINSATVGNINTLLRPPEWYHFGRNYGSDVTAALVMWGAKVAPGQDWDHKPKITDRFGLKEKSDFYFKQPGEDREVFYDLYSNVHYGYVGRAAGLDEGTLIEGASLGETMLTGDDDAGDQITMRIGIDLYDKYGKDMTQEQLHQGIIEAMDKMEQAKQDGKDVPQIRGAK